MLKKPVYSTCIEKNLNYRFRTLAKEWINVNRMEDEVTVTVNSADVIEPDLHVTNGVVHVVNRVLLCPCVEGAVEALAPEETDIVA